MLMTSHAPATPLPLLTGERPHPLVRLAIFAAWLVAAAWLAQHHVFWRDEVRAFSLALEGDSVLAMLRRLQGEGHPALWYLLLRATHALTGARETLPATAFAIGAGAAALWAWRAPFRPAVLAMALFGAFALHEYTVSARNYGIAMLLLFAFAAAYPRAKERGPWLGLLLALLCNTNAPAVMLGGALGLFWAAEIASTEGWRWTPRWRHWAGNMALALFGVGACLVTIYPPFNDAAVSPLAGQLTPTRLLFALADIAGPFDALWPASCAGLPGARLLLTVLIVGAPLGLVRSPGGLLAGVVITLAMPLFFQLVYPGGYRHQALFVAFLLTLYWLVADSGGGRWPAARPLLRPAAQALLQRTGQIALVALLLAQVATSAELIGATANSSVASRAADLATLIRHERLERAVVIANPDVLLEPLPYYTPNPLWLVRERRAGRVVAFTRAAVRDVTLAEMLATAQALRARTRRPVLTLLQVRLDPAAPSQTWDEAYNGTFSTTPGDVRAFLRATRRLARFAPAISDESYDVYLLR